MALTLKKAQRKRVKLKIGLAAPSGGGKTASSLILGYGLLKGEHPDWGDEQIWDHIAIIDTENGSGELYANCNIGGTVIGAYNAISLEPPYEPSKYIEAINACKDAGMEVCIVDSLSHAWSGRGGLLEKQGNVSKRTGNSYTAWREITPLHNALVDTLLQTDMHVICTMRSKTEYVQEKDEKGRTTVRKVGMAPVQRDGMEYEFSMFLEIDAEHQAFVSKDRTGVIDGQYFVVTPSVGEKLAKWLDSGAPEDSKPVVVAEYKESAPATTTVEDVPSKILAIDAKVKQLQGSGVPKDSIIAAVKSVMGTTANYNRITDMKTADGVMEKLNGLEDN